VAFEPQRDGATTQPIGVAVGHWADAGALTGCTVVVFDRPASAVVDVRGGAPGTRETDLLAPGRLVRHVDAIMLTGGSAFGLAAADGVMRHLAELGRGVATPAGPVPIVPAAVIFDLAVGRPVAPDARAANLACAARVPVASVERGQVGVGTGATTDKLLSGTRARGGFGAAHQDCSGGSVRALVVVNAAGTVVDPGTGRPILDGTSDERLRLLENASTAPTMGAREATTIGVLLVSAPADESALIRAAVAGHDAIARAIRPSHTIFDGDIVFACGLVPGAPTPADILATSIAAELAMERAIVDAVTV
jgi:L-aminopeptidase/D-esterase-like protein